MALIKMGHENAVIGPDHGMVQTNIVKVSEKTSLSEFSDM